MPTRELRRSSSLQTTLHRPVARSAKEAARNAVEASQIVGPANRSKDNGTITVAARVTVEASYEPEHLSVKLSLRKLLR